MMSLTMPQIVMYNHASWHNHKSIEARTENKKAAPESKASPEPKLMNEKGELVVSTDRYMAYWVRNPVGA